MSSRSRNSVQAVLICGLLASAFALGVRFRGDAPSSPDPGLGLTGGTAVARTSAAAPAQPSDPPATDAPPARRSARHSVVVDIARDNSPAVVTVGTTRIVARRAPVYGSFGFFSQRYLEEGDFPYVGSGFIADMHSLLEEGEAPQDGDLSRNRYYVLTNYHVVDEAEKIYITMTDGREFPARLLDADQVVDVALLEIVAEAGAEFETVRLGDSDEIMIGESVVALGNPFGPLIEDPHPTVTVGVISALNRSFQPDVDPRTGAPRVYHDMIQTDAAVNPGNSGGPLLNFDGEVIGVNTFIISPAASSGVGGSAGVNFSIPINRARKVAREIIRFGRVRSLYLDFDVVSISPQLVRRYDLPESRGLLVWNIAREGPAAAAGLELGDVIVKVEGREIGSREDLLAVFYSRTVGESLRFTVSRGGGPAEIRYRIEEGK